ncbi:NAD-dependent epimerase/dehydratase family protein [Nocardia yunnanensis]|uniref:NAD-dependent epimerase/dehydratase family protein n=1 Tax=Nocardia yunnanensis TaxID=2382165 RepID=A0A386ZHU7_9NOCA|nr:SDR family oxidoreductase [Nocardia yunnanensis]AYF77091.1 NAD-dependent epimerase/dehydratase family protein [Nocardia yunnanensis]
MAYLVTGATGFIGRFLVPELLKRGADVHVLVRPGEDSVLRFNRCLRDWDARDRVRPVRGDLAAPGLGIDSEWLAAQRGSIDHVFHLAAGFDSVGAGGGTRRVAEIAARLEAGWLHHVSTARIAGNRSGVFTEDMTDVGQLLPTPYQRAMLRAEQDVRDQTGVPWRIYRPSLIIGHSRTGEIDRIDGPYYFFRLLRMAAQLPRILPVVSPKLGETNMVPVDFVARALDHIAHRPGDGPSTYHLVDPREQSVAEVFNLFADEAGAPHLIELMPKPTLDVTLRVPGMGWALRQIGIPTDVIEDSEFACRFDSRHTQAALAGTDIKVPPLAAYAAIIWKYWIENWV